MSAISRGLILTSHAQYKHKTPNARTQMYNPNYGSVFRAEGEPTLFAFGTSFRLA